MKKLLFSLAAIVALVATSCVQADVEDINLGGNEGVVTFVIKTDALGSRTINDGEKATALSYGIYDKDWTLIKTDTATMKGLATTLELRLVKKRPTTSLSGLRTRVLIATLSISQARL